MLSESKYTASFLTFYGIIHEGIYSKYWLHLIVLILIKLLILPLGLFPYHCNHSDTYRLSIIIQCRYQIVVLELLSPSKLERQTADWSSLVDESMKCQFEEIHAPSGLDLSKNTEFASQAALWGIEVSSCLLSKYQKLGIFWLQRSWKAILNLWIRVCQNFYWNRNQGFIISRVCQNWVKFILWVALGTGLV